MNDLIVVIKAKFCWIFPLILLALAVSDCSRPNSEEDRAKQIYSEIKEIAQKPVSGRTSNEIMESMNRLHQAKENFPMNRHETIIDARKGKEFFSAAIEGNMRIAALWTELLTLHLSETDSNCAKSSLETQKAQIEQMNLTLKQLDLFLDENIRDKSTLELRGSQMKRDSEMIENEIDELAKRQVSFCSKSALGLHE